MITEQEILKGEVCPPEYKENLKELLVKLNKLRDLWAKPMSITSGFRSWETHLRVYRDKGITDLSKIPSKSKHLYCQAADISDPNFELTKFCKEHTKEMEEIGIWFEDDMSVKRLHIQSVPPKSNSRWFKP